MDHQKSTSVIEVLAPKFEGERSVSNWKVYRLNFVSYYLMSIRDPGCNFLIFVIQFCSHYVFRLC